MHREARQAHFGDDLNALLSTVPAEFIYVRDGRIETQSQEERRKRFTQYFQGAQFTAWDDLEPPIVHVSPDGQMGWMVVRVKFAINRTDASGKKTKESTVMAWMSAYEKHEGRWQHVANATTLER